MGDDDKVESESERVAWAKVTELTGKLAQADLEVENLMRMLANISQRPTAEVDQKLADAEATISIQKQIIEVLKKEFRALGTALANSAAVALNVARE